MAKKSTTVTKPHELSQNLLLGFYIATLVLCFGGSFLTDQRLWGFSTWGYLPIWGRAILLLLGVASIPLALKLLPAESSTPAQDQQSTKSFLSLGIILAVLFGASFWLLRGRTHFLGDGYTNLSTLTGEHPIIKGREIGESILHLWLARALGGTSLATVLLSYQIIALAAGVLLVLAVAWTATKLFEKTLDRFLFTLGLATAGQMLLFFGYVENYGLFALSIGSFTCLGILCARRKITRWLVLIPVALSIFFHIFGVTLIPAALYLLISGTTYEKKIERLSAPARTFWIAILVVLAGVALWFGLSQSMFFRIALLSFTTTQFTIESYTLFSVRHLIDFLNLLLLLVPGLLIAAVVLITSPARKLFKEPEYRFLALLILSVLGAAFIFDPKLGMPRDWDLYSFPAIPMAALTLLVLLDRRFVSARGRLAATFGIVAGLLTLSARVTTQVVPSAALHQINDYIALDKIKSKNALVYLQTYCLEIGDTSRAEALKAQYESLPDELLYRQIARQLNSGISSGVLQMAQQAAKYNPMSTQAYAYMGSAYLRLGQVDQAIAALNTSLALNPHNSEALTGLGFIYFNLGKSEAAEQTYLRAAEYDPQKSTPFYYLAKMYQQRRQFDRQLDYLMQATAKDDATGEMFADLADLFLSRGQAEKAADAFKAGLGHALDTNLVKDRIVRFPQLRPYFSPPPPAH